MEISNRTPIFEIYEIPILLLHLLEFNGVEESLRIIGQNL
jgi:hypothetical protein